MPDSDDSAKKPGKSADVSAEDEFLEMDMELDGFDASAGDLLGGLDMDDEDDESSSD